MADPRPHPHPHPQQQPPQPPPSLCTPLEQEVLDEYTRVLSNLNKLSSHLASLADRPAAEILDGLRLLERKTSLVCTLLKASVYSIVLQQQVYGGDEDGDGGG
ncbi:MAG: hypothetical protein LQ338_003787 [Usnochroma carphineum]|nr:MAG: hypothetical protein LQ338_003787 [Usnochroma carphineum]